MGIKSHEAIKRILKRTLENLNDLSVVFQDDEEFYRSNNLDKERVLYEGSKIGIHEIFLEYSEKQRGQDGNQDL
jgi:hypothetical protein